MNNSAQSSKARIKRRGLGLALLLAIGFAAFISIQPSPVQVETEAVIHRALLLTVNEQGRTRAQEPFTIAAPFYGQLLRTDKIEGDKIAVGDVLNTIAVAPENLRTRAVLEANLTAAQARLSAAQASVEETQSVLERTRQELRRRERLLAQRLIGLEERDSFAQAFSAAQTREAAAQANLQAARAETESAKSQLIGIDAQSPTGLVPIIAPVQGTIQRVFEKSQRIVNAGTPLFLISDRDSLELVIDLLTQDAVKVSPGDEIQITGWGGQQTLRGRVKYIEPEAFTKYSALGVEEQRVNVIGELIDPNPGLGAEYRIEAAIVIAEKDNALTIPTSALFRRNNHWHTFVAAGGEASLRAIEIGERSIDYAEVLSGVAIGDEVIVFPSDLVNDGVEIQRIAQ